MHEPSTTSVTDTARRQGQTASAHRAGGTAGLDSSLRRTRFVSLIRSIYLERRTGVLEIKGPGLKKRLYFISGELHLRRSDLPLARKIASYLGKGDGSGRSPGSSGEKDRSELEVLTGLIAERLTDWNATGFWFYHDLDTMPEDLIGALPTSQLLVAAARAAHTEELILDLLGGPGASIVAVPADETPRGSAVSRFEDALILARCRQPAIVGELLESVTDGQNALWTLARLWVVGLVRPMPPEPPRLEEAPHTGPATVDAAPEERTATGTQHIWRQHFGLRAEPFSLTPDPAVLYLSDGHAEALAALEVSLLERRGLTVLIGEVGTGKTTVLYSLLDGLGPEFQAAYIANTTLPFDEILELALVDLGAEVTGRRRVDLLQSLNRYLTMSDRQGKTVALVIDEAQNLSTEAFEGLRQLLNFETYAKKLLQIILVGQPELGARLRRADLRQVADRIAVRSELEPLRPEEARHYIEHRLEAVGGSSTIFSPAALQMIVRAARKIPRSINVLCHNAMVFAFAEGLTRVDESVAREAIKARRGRAVRRPELRLWRPLRWISGAALIAAAGVLAGLADSPEAENRVGEAVTQGPQSSTAQKTHERPSSVSPISMSDETRRDQPAASEVQGPVSGTTTVNLNLRAGPSLTDLVLATIPSGTKIEFLIGDGGWSVVHYEGLFGWSATAHLPTDPAENTALE